MRKRLTATIDLWNNAKMNTATAKELSLWGANKEILDLFNVMVYDKNFGTPNVQNVGHGFVTNFDPTYSQLKVLKEHFKPIGLRTFFTVEERENGDMLDLMKKQILHYIEVYGLGMEGTLTVPLSNENIVTLKYVRGVTTIELSDMVRSLIYQNAPVKNAAALKKIIQDHGIEYDINLVKNNELRILLFDVARDVFQNGDDAVRWMCYAATEKPMLIKSPEVIKAVKMHFLNRDSTYFRNHRIVLATVFHRHKKLILAAKGKYNRTVINQISKLSKSQHIPIREHVSKTFIHMALSDRNFPSLKVLGHCSVRDKLKYLNLLAYKKTQQTHDAFTVRNGKVHIRGDRKIYDLHEIKRVETDVLMSLTYDLSGLNDKHILLDASVDYGLPVSRKQSLGNLPYGTTITVNGDRISSGIYWENAGGSTDLDLSTVNEDGDRIGWGSISGYNSEGVLFSGDITNAPSGAMEFMTSADKKYGLFVNIYSGDTPTEMELVVGTQAESKWIKNTIIREKHILDSRSCLLGYVNNKSFVVYSGRIGSQRANFDTQKNAALAARGTYDFWTVGTLLEAIGIQYSFDAEDGVDYDIDLSYDGFSYDKLEEVFTV